MRTLDRIPIFFIVGRPRSGTTLLRALFETNPNVCFPPECQFIINLYPKYGNLIKWERRDIISFIYDLQQQWLFKTWKVDIEQLKEKLLGVREEISYGVVCKLVLMQYKSIFPKEEVLFFGDKNPGYTIYTEQLLKIFPNAKFIHIIRDYRDHFVSIKNVDFDLPYISLISCKWRLFIKKYRDVMEKYPNSHIEVRYEDLVTYPEKEMKILCNFVGVPFGAEMFNFHLKADEARKFYAPILLEKLFSSLFNKINTDKIGVYKTQLSIRQIKMADMTVGKYAEMMGYRREFKNYNMGIILMSSPGIILAKTLQYMTKVANYLPYRVRATILSRWPLRMARFYLSIFNPNKLKGLRR